MNRVYLKENETSEKLCKQSIHFMWRGYVYILLKRRDHLLNHMYFISTRDTTTGPYCPWALRCKKKTPVSLLLWTVFICLSYFHLWFLCELTGKHRFAASLEMLNLDIRKTNNICLLSKNSLAELLPWWRYHTCRLNKAVRCLYHTVIPNLNRVLERIPIKFTLLKSSRHLWQG